MGKLVKLYNKLQDGGPGIPAMQQDVTKVKKQLPVISTMIPNNSTPGLSRDQMIKLTGNKKLPYDYGDWRPLQNGVATYEAGLAEKYSTNKRPQLTIKDNKYNIRNNEKINPDMLDDLVKGSVKANVDPYTALAIAQRESGLGNVSKKGGAITRNQVNPNYIFSNWAANSMGMSNEELKYTKQANASVDNDAGTTTSIPAFVGDKMAKFVKNNTQYPFQSEMNTINSLTKNGTFIRGYNYGDPDYPNKVAKEKEILMSPDNAPFRKYVDSVTNVAKQELPQMAEGGIMRTTPNKVKSKFPSMMKRMDDGGLWQDTNKWATKNQQGISAVAGYGAATVDAFAPTDSYGVRSNGAAFGSGALSGAGKGAAVGSLLGPEGTLIGAGVGAVVGGVEGLVGNKKASALKTQTINKSSINQLQADQSSADTRIAGDPSLKYGRMSASYYRFGGVMKNSPAALPRSSKPLPAVQPAQRLMPNITESPNRQMSKMTYGGSSGGVMAPQIPNALRYSATKLFRPDKSLKAQKNQILTNGGTLHKQGHIKPHFASKGQPQATSSSAPQVPAVQPQQQMDPNQVAQMQQMLQQQGGMQQHANGGPIHINPANKGKFNATKLATGKSTEELTHSSNPVTKKRAIFAQNFSKKADGGQVEQLSSQDTMINGPSHEDGGVKFPNAGVELEGGETVNNGFVFSKKLGFAKPAAVIAGQLGKAEKRPETAINTATVNALQRKTELLKVHQEAAKKEAGIPSDLPQMAIGGPMPTDTITIKPALNSLAKNPAAPLSKINPLMVEKADGSIGQWGNPVPSSTAPVTPGMKTIPDLSDKSKGLSSVYYPANSTMKGKTPDIIRPSTGRVYRFGGNLKKMDEGGTPWASAANPAPAYPWSGNPVGDMMKFPGGRYIREVTINGNQGPDLSGTGLPSVSVPQVTKPSTTAAQTVPGTSSNVFNDVAGKVTPFLSNFVNATQKLPLPPVPQLNTEITPNLVDYSASRNEAVRANRSANASARTNLNSGAAVSATQAANLAGQTRAVSQINEAENNQNAQIRNSTAAENAQIRVGNTALQNNYQNELVQRQIKGQSLKSANMANLEEKIQGMAKDKKMFDLEGEKAVLGYLTNNDSGAGWEAARPIVSKHVTPEQLTQMDTWATKARADGKAESLKNLSNYKMQSDYLRGKGVSEDVINGLSTVSPGRVKPTGSKKTVEKSGNTTSTTTTKLFE